MKKLENLRFLMMQNGMLGNLERAASLGIVPLGDDLFDPYGSLSQDKPGQPPVAEGGATCDTCANGCQSCSQCREGCSSGCGAGCVHGII